MQGLEGSIFPALGQESVLRLTVFLAVFLLMALSEAWAPRRQPPPRRRWRWPINLGVMVISTLMVKGLLPFTAVTFALWVEAHQWGLFNKLSLPLGLTVVSTLLIMDLAIYFQHRLLHAVPWLWRLHRMHHADPEFDVTTGIRFHPLEILLSMGFKWGVIVVLGPPVLAVLLFEILLNATSLFNHANMNLPAWLDRGLRRIIVTPDMHRVHHSWRQDETNSNFGFNLPWWDFLLGTYRPQPADGHQCMIIGLRDFREG